MKTTLNRDYWGAENATKPWNSADSKDVPSDRIHTCDPQEQIKLCLNCTLKKCSGDSDCWLRTGKEKPKRGRPTQKAPDVKVRTPAEPQPPAGYDEEKLMKAMVHSYSDREIADCLGLSLYMTKKWLAWRYR